MCVSLFLASARAFDLAGRARSVCLRTHAQALTHAHTHEHMRMCVRVHSRARADSPRIDTHKSRKRAVKEDLRLETDLEQQ
jgi:hypothetical protein